MNALPLFRKVNFVIEVFYMLRTRVRRRYGDTCVLLEF